MASPSSPTLPLADGAASIGSFADPVVVDPDPALLSGLVAAYRDAAPAAVDPDLDALRAGAGAHDGSPSRGSDPRSGLRDLPPLTVLARDRAIDAVTARFRAAGRLAALVEGGVWELRSLAEPQPNAVLAGRSDGCVLVATAGRDDEGERDEERWCRIGADATLRDRYEPLLADADEVRIRTSSRHRLYGALRARCGAGVADEVVELLDADAGSESIDRSEARVRTYAAGARRGALDRDLRRACEDAGLGSSATFTRVKRELTAAGLLGTEPVSQPVGRPRQRLVARGALADASSPIDALVALDGI